MEQTSFAIESVRDTQTTISAMQAASKQLKIEHKKIDIGAIEDMQDDLSGTYVRANVTCVQFVCVILSFFIFNFLFCSINWSIL